MTDDERTINSLKNALSKKIDDALRAQAALTVARHRLGLSDPRQIYTAAEMDAVHTESRAEMRGMVSAVISDCRSRWDRSYVPTPLEKAMAKWPAAFAALDAAKQVQVAGRDNVISLAQQIADAGRKRRGESS